MRIRRRDTFFNAACRGAAGLLSGSDTGDALFGVAHPRTNGAAAAEDATGNGSGRGKSLKRRTLPTYSIHEHFAAPGPATGQAARRFEVRVRSVIEKRKKKQPQARGY